MADLNEDIKTVTIKDWDRAYDISIKNIFGKPPLLTFHIERARLIGAEFSSKKLNTLQVAFDPTEKFPLINPLTNEPIGIDGDQTQLQVILYSLFKAKVK